MKIIRIKLQKDLSSLAGNKFGEECFKKYIGFVDCNEKYTIIFDDNIRFIASSFIQGFFNEFLDQIGFDGIINNIKIEANGINNLMQIVLDSLN